MSSHSNSSNRISSSLVNKLVSHVTRKPPEQINKQYRFALQLLSTSFVHEHYDEFTVSEKIKKQFMLQDKKNEALVFMDLFRKLQTSTVLKNRACVLHLLCCLYDFNGKLDAARFENGPEKHENIASDLTLNVHDIINNKNVTVRPKSITLEDLSRVSIGKDLTVYRSQALKSGCKINETSYFNPENNRAVRSPALFSASGEKQQHYLSCPSKDHIEKALTIRSEESNLGSISLTISNLKPLLQDILFAMQGLKGNIIVWDPEKSNFNVIFHGEFPKPIKQLTLRFVEMGWMYHRINHYCKVQSSEKALGLIGQSFIAALKENLTEYYRLIAQLEAFLSQETTLTSAYSSSNSLTLHRLSVWCFEPHMQLKILASVVDACKGKKGGALASVLYSHLQHGDSSVRNLIQNLLCIVTRPLFKMLSNWVYCGELDDAYGEFFVATNIAVSDNCLWQEKYSLNKAMIPSFISMDQARKILSTGKAINFLRQVCQDNTFARDEDRRIRALELMSTQSLFSQENDTKFETMLEANYVKTSKSVLKVLNNEYNLMDHLLAMRNYFLLGQGDFIRHLMDLLDTDLAKKATMLYIHNLSGILESAIRATNAQFHNPEVLQRLDVRLLEASLGDTGWDVFSLDYHVEGPIGTIFTSQSKTSYLRLFSTLWRAKHMEYVLSKISQSRTTYLKLQDSVPVVTPILYQCHFILAQMVHFVQQMQYYMAFEVMECCWADLQLKISSAQDLDHVIDAHEQFLDTLLRRALLDEESLGLRNQLKAIYMQIIQFHEIQESFWKDVRQVVDALEEKEDDMLKRTASGTWGLTDKHKIKYQDALAKLVKSGIPSTKGKLRVLSYQYEDMVQKFLIMLNDHADPNLRFLSFRLDFNEHFKSKNSRLQTSLTYQHRRKSIR